MTPRRYQREETTGYRLPPHTIFVGAPTRWENPFIHGRVSKRNPIKTSGRAALKFHAAFDHICIITLFPNHPISQIQAMLWHREWLVTGRPPAEIIPWWDEVYLRDPGNPDEHDCEFGEKLTAAIMETRRKTLADVRALKGENLASWDRLCDSHRDTGKQMGLRCDHCAPSHTDTLLDVANR